MKDIFQMTDEEMQAEFDRLFYLLSDSDQNMISELIWLCQPTRKSV